MNQIIGPQPLASRYFAALTGLRAIAAYLVFVHHHNYFPLDQGNIYWFLHMISQEGHIGVSIFFVLSGFLVTWRYLEEAKLTKIWLKKYFINRFAKIWPLYWILLFATYGVSGWPNDRILIFTNVTLLKGFFENYKFTGIPQSWSLTVEETFYFFAPWTFVFLRKHSKSLLRTFLPVPIFLVLGWILYGVVGLHFPWNSLFYGYGRGLGALFYTFFGRCFEFFVGIFLARFMLKWKQGDMRRPNLPKYMTHTGLVGIFACLCFMIYYVRAREEFYQASGMILLSVILPPFIGSLIFGLIHEDTFLRRILSSRILGMLGKSSYAFYLLDSTSVIRYFSFCYANSVVSEGGAISWAIRFLIMNVIAAALYFLVENPLNQLIRGESKILKYLSA